MRDNSDLKPAFAEWNQLVQIARLGLSGKTADLEKYLRRIVVEMPPEVAGKVGEMLAQTGQMHRGIASKSSASAPMDSDSRLLLLRTDLTPTPAKLLFFSAAVTRELARFVAERQAAPRLLAAGVSPPTSMLFSGPPGVGKTKGAELIAARLKLPLLTLDLSAVMSSYLGKTGQNIRYVLDHAKSQACVLLLDEFDSIAKRRDSSDDSGELRRLVNVLLQEIDEWPSTGVLIAATNHPDLLDPAIWRRFDHVINFERPGRDEIIELILDRADKNLDPRSIETLVILFSGWSHSQVESTISRARRLSVLNAKPLELALFEALHEPILAMANANKKSVCKRLSELEFSLRDIGDLVGVNKSTVQRWINEK